MNRISRPWTVLAFVFLLAGTRVAAQVPPEVPSLDWCPEARDCLQWPGIAGADSYAVYRGPLDTASHLVTGESSACLAGTFAQTTTGPVLGHPAPAGGYWYLVTAINLVGEGSAGSGSGGPRVVASGGPCTPAGALVLNEVDYDQPGSDVGEFVEIYNAGPVERSLAGLALVFVNGTTSGEYGRVDLGAVASSLAPGGFLVAGTAAVLAGLPPGTPAVLLPTALQNGSPDGLALVDTVAGALLDGLSYEGEIRMATFEGVAGTFDLVDGQPALAEDSSTVDGSLARLPDGNDTGDDEADWSFVGLPTPGVANAAR